MIDQIQCPFCKSAVKSIWRGNIFYECKNCHLLIRNVDISYDQLDDLYQTSWVSPFDRIDETGGTTDRLAENYVKQLINTLGVKSFKDNVIIDYGAGRGAMSFALQDFGANVYAVEPYGYEFLKEKGLQAYKSMNDLPDGLIISGIVSLDVVEHLPEPWTDLQLLYEKLPSGGWIFLSTPNSKGLNAFVYREKWREVKRTGHLYLFCNLSLQKQLNSAGFTRIKKLHWNVIYRPSIPIQIKDWVLNKLKLDGELRFIAVKQ